MRNLMHAIFIERTLKIRFCAAYSLVFGGSVRGLSHHRYNDYELKLCIPNTHIDAYSCLGNYQMTLNTLVLNNDYIGAIEQCIASCKSLNFADSVVMQEFMANFYGLNGACVNNRCVELPTGDVVTPKEAVAWMHSQKEGEEANE